MRSVLMMIVVTACAPSPQGPVHAPGAPAEASPVSTSMGGSTPEPSSGWFCYESRLDPYTMTWCARTLDECASLRDIEMGHTRPGWSWSACEPHDRAYCYSFDDQKEREELRSCYTSAAECDHVHATAIELAAEPGDEHPVPGTITPCVETR